ncbi:MAG: hypothetical protein ACRDTH_12835 [Pseudonocardiaceae bacterium]
MITAVDTYVLLDVFTADLSPLERRSADCAAQARRSYRTRDDSPQRVIADFLIGTRPCTGC